MVVDKPFNGNTYYEGFSKHIKTLEELPALIQYNLKGYTDKILGKISDSITYSHGQVIDLESKFKKDSAAYRSEWVIPKYDLNFLLSDNNLGIKSYYLQIRLDQYGQIIDCNWPKKGHGEKNLFKSRIEIENFAIKQARLKGFDTTQYIVDFRFNQKLDKLCWVFMFPIKIEENRKEYGILEVPWTSLEIVHDGIQIRSTVQ